MKTARRNLQWKRWLFLFNVLMSFSGFAIAQETVTEYDSTLTQPKETGAIPTPLVRKHLLRNKYDIFLPGMGEFKNLSEDEMSNKLNEYADMWSEQLGASADDGPITIKRGWNNIKDGLSDEIEGILGEAEDKIMNGIRDEIEMALSSVLGAIGGGSTPLSAVIKLKKLVKEGLSKQQKIDLQNYKANYEWKASQTDLSSEFVNYYKELNLKDEFANYYKVTGSIDRLLNSGQFTSQQKQMALKIVNETKLDDLADQVKIIVNKSSKPVWMNEGDRVRLLDEVATDLKARSEKMRQLSMLLMTSYTSKKKKVQENNLTRSLYAPNSHSYVRNQPK